MSTIVSSDPDSSKLSTVESPSVVKSEINDRYEPRFRVFSIETLRDLECQLSFRPTADRAFRIPCKMVDLNTSGCAIRYQLPRPLPIAAAATMLEIKNFLGHEAMQMLARVCWSRQTGIDQFTSGLYFRRALPDELIASGVREGRLTRRTAKREAIDVSVCIRQSQPSLTTAARIVSTSRSGLQVVGPAPLSVGARIMLQLRDGTAVVGKTAWCTTRESEYAAGVAFIQVATGRQFHETVLGQA